MQFTLASESARRVDLLRMVGYDFASRKSGFPEVTLRDPGATVRANARGKALGVAEGLENGGVVLGADTIVYLPEEGDILGQPTSEEDVARMLGLLSGRTHEVYSGVAVTGGDNDDDGRVSAETVVTAVRMRPLLRDEIDAYASSGEGLGKAGGYGIQGRAALFVEGIQGDYTNVVGLPLSTTARLLEERGVRWF